MDPTLQCSSVRAGVCNCEFNWLYVAAEQFTRSLLRVVAGPRDVAYILYSAVHVLRSAMSCALGWRIAADASRVDEICEVRITRGEGEYGF